MKIENENGEREGDWIADQLFSSADLQVSLEEYAARKGTWVHRLQEILSYDKVMGKRRE